MSNIRALTRNDVSLNIDGAGETKEYFDQICALSAKTINKNFDILFKQRPEIKELVYDNGDAGIGRLEATVKAPRILIEPNQSTNTAPEIIDKGSIYYPGSPTVTIDGWVITVDIQEDDVRFPAEDALKEIQTTHIIPESDPTKPIKMRAGEYSIHRLFAAISETGWALPDPIKSTVPIGPVNMTLAEWEQQSPKNHNMASKVKTTLGSWASEHQYSGFFTLGLEVSVPSPKGQLMSLVRKRIPTGLRLQNYPFIDDGDYINMLKANQVPRGIVDNDWNCLVWCETCDGKEIPAKGKAIIPYSGNLAMPNPNADLEVYGTFVMNGNLFFDNYLLKELKVFCLGTQVVPLTPKMYTDPHGKGVEACVSMPVIACGSISKALSDEDRNGLKFIPPDSSTDDYYAFERTGTYEWNWHKKLEAPGSGERIHDYGNGNPPGQTVYRKYTTESDMSVNIKRIEGTSRLKIWGTNLYNHWEGYFNNTNFPWNLVVNLSPENATSQSGVITPVIEGLNEDKTLPADMQVVVTDEAYNISNSHEEMKVIIKKNMANSLKSSTLFIENRFDSAGRFFYPGTGVLEFKEPYLSDTGHIYCNIDYKP
ncbi:hypothetical protein LZ32DRAFT_544368 [Colletotrichum eremochloae]|nr:hypothetical protein LZ32DRAFT_544368 [Colletotrichum eremochloae]